MGLLTDIQTAIKDRLESIEYFQGITVVCESKGDIVSEVNAALLKVGAGILVTTPAAYSDKPNVPGPQFLTPGGGIKVRVQVYEAVSINRGSQGSQKPASDIAENVAAYLHLFVPTISGTQLGLLACDPGQAAIVSDYDAERNMLIYDINLITHGGLVVV